VKDTEFEIFHGDTLTNDWEMLRELNPAKKPAFDAIVANPPFSYARRVAMEEIEKNDFNLNISRYVSTAVGEAEIDLDVVHAELVDVERAITEAKQRHNGFLKELGLKPLP
jgi:type I restriction-modification system DNA methylase subunit